MSETGEHGPSFQQEFPEKVIAEGALSCSENDISGGYMENEVETREDDSASKTITKNVIVDDKIDAKDTNYGREKRFMSSNRRVAQEKNVAHKSCMTKKTYSSQALEHAELTESFCNKNDGRNIYEVTYIIDWYAVNDLKSKYFM